jgi:TPR repeat protein
MSERIVTFALVVCASLLSLGPAGALDGARSPVTVTTSDIVQQPLPPLPGTATPSPAAPAVRAAPPAAAMGPAARAGLPPAGAMAPLSSPVDAFRSGAQALRDGQTAKGLSALQYAADQGHPVAQWKLGRMYADGEGVPQDDAKAFDFFQRIANSHADDNPAAPQSRFVANAFVALGHYYLDGIANSDIKADPRRAREMFQYAAAYFGDADAQYQLARLFLDGVGVERDARQAARWLGLSANKGQVQAQAVLGQMLFVGRDVPRQAARGLMWLTLARDSAGPDEKWIVEMHEKASAQATPDERSMALVLIERYVRGKSEN